MVMITVTITIITIIISIYSITTILSSIIIITIIEALFILALPPGLPFAPFSCRNGISEYKFRSFSVA